VRVCYISPATVSELAGGVTTQEEQFAQVSEFPPLGILSLASVIGDGGTSQELFSLNHLSHECGPDSKEGFFRSATAELTRCAADVFGFSTLAGSYPLTVRLAREAKRIHPDSIVVFGGPQATAVDLQTLEAFPFVDVVVRGEAEITFPELLDSLNDRTNWERIAGISFRRNGKILRTPERMELPDLDALPTPAYALLPAMEGQESISLEIGRGCPFACTFCSTSGFFRRRYRLKSPARMLEQMRSLRIDFGISSFTLVHDAFTVDRQRVLAFCSALQESGEHFRWTCSARTDCVDEALMDRMAAAGCVGIFFGVESGSEQVQRSIGKNLDLGEARFAIRVANGHGMKTAVSLIAGFPDETMDNLRATVDFLLDSMRFDCVTPQVHVLAPLAGTELHRRQTEFLKWDGTSSDIASQGWPQTPADEALIRAHPAIFPDFYVVPTAHFDRRYLLDLDGFLMRMMVRLRWLALALHQLTGNLLNVFERWREWPSKANFETDFIEFVSHQYLSDLEDPDTVAVATLVEYLRQHKDLPNCPNAEEPAAETTSMHAVPRLAPWIALFYLPADYASIIDRLRERQSPRDVQRCPMKVADRVNADGSAEVVQLSPLSAALLKLCDGTRTVEEIAAVFPQLDASLAALPARPASLFALNELARQRLLVFAGL
jgi:hypothetical protein